MIDPKLLTILACPRCADRPKLQALGALLVCPKCGHGYRVVNGIPHLLAAESIPPDQVAAAAQETRHE